MGSLRINLNGINQNMYIGIDHLNPLRCLTPPPPSIPTKQHGHWLLAVTCIAQSSLTKLRFYQMINKNDKLDLLCHGLLPGKTAYNY